MNMENTGGVLTSTTGDAQPPLNSWHTGGGRALWRYEGEASAERTFIITCRALLHRTPAGVGPPRRSRTAAGFTLCPNCRAGAAY